MSAGILPIYLGLLWIRFSISPISLSLQSQLSVGICGGRIHLLPPHLLSTESIFIIYVEVYKPWSQTTAKQSNLSCSPRPCRYSYIFQEHLSSMELVMHLEKKKKKKKIPIPYPNVNLSLNHTNRFW